MGFFKLQFSYFSTEMFQLLPPNAFLKKKSVLKTF